MAGFMDIGQTMGLLDFFGVSVDGQTIVYMALLGSIAIGLVMLGAGVLLLLKYNKLKQECSAQVIGTVSEVTEGWGSVTRTYCTRFKYTVRDIEYSKLSDVSSRRRLYAGQCVTVLYDPTNPNRFLILEEKPVYMFSILILVGIGVAGIVFGAAGFAALILVF